MDNIFVLKQEDSILAIARRVQGRVSCFYKRGKSPKRWVGVGWMIQGFIWKNPLTIAILAAVVE
ncbi:hypothetical protein J0895_21355 [Phormidium pseudopriestleyi FRX01]|uniref:Transposase n=1 Tax=Phormidium pseudopriestleyi FRX01 TaxID=1759528 RepID=A0ABS3FZ20_9CYAN|nr:hypothetical protein [Phormidium pseudopriestleyi]MBO0351582.1 hypothetical protein [Phormidium pseudopriestleyi FRX01]